MKLGPRLERDIEELNYDEWSEFIKNSTPIFEDGYMSNTLNVYEKLELMRAQFALCDDIDPLDSWFLYYEWTETEPPLRKYIREHKVKKLSWSNLSNIIQHYYFGECHKLNHKDIVFKLPFKMILEIREQEYNKFRAQSDCRYMFIQSVRLFEMEFGKNNKDKMTESLSDLPENLKWVSDVFSLADKWTTQFLGELSKYISWYFFDLNKSREFEESDPEKSKYWIEVSESTKELCIQYDDNAAPRYATLVGDF